VASVPGESLLGIETEALSEAELDQRIEEVFEKGGEAEFRPWFLTEIVKHLDYSELKRRAEAAGEELGSCRCIDRIMFFDELLVRHPDRLKTHYHCAPDCRTNHRRRGVVCRPASTAYAEAKACKAHPPSVVQP